MSSIFKTFLYVIIGVVGGLFVAAYVLKVLLRRDAILGITQKNIVTILAGIAVVSAIIWTIFYVVRPNSSNSLSPVKGDVAKQNIIGVSADLLNGFYGGNGGGSFGTYVFLTNYEHTKLVGGEGLNTPLIRLGTTRMYVNNNNDSYNTYLEIDAKDAGGKTVKEKVVLEDFPMQKWVYVSINREGRRFTVYYNGIIAGSHVIDNMYVVRTDAARIGNASYRGMYVYPTINPSIMREGDIKAYIKKTANTKNEPIMPMDFWATISGISVFCSDGTCGGKGISTGAPPGLKWDTQFG